MLTAYGKMDEERQTLQEKIDQQKSVVEKRKSELITKYFNKRPKM